MPRDLTPEIITSIRQLVAVQLWQLGAVKVNLETPFRLVSGNYSPIYINCRQLISAPAFADLFGAASRILCEAHDIRFDVVAGGETAGIPFAAILARTFAKPMAYVRKATKEHGLGSLVEGVFSQDARVLLVEDLITDAGSKLHFIEGIKRAGGTVPGVLVIFDRQQGGYELLASMNIRLLSITDMETALNVAQAVGLLGVSELASVNKYLQSPGDWHTERNLDYIK